MLQTVEVTNDNVAFALTNSINVSHIIFGKRPGNVNNACLDIIWKRVLLVVIDKLVLLPFNALDKGSVDFLV